MAPIAVADITEPVLAEAPIPDVVAPKAKYNDWRADLQRDGYCVVKGAVPREQALRYQQRAFEWMKSFNNPELDFNNPETWIKANLPVSSTINTFNSYCVAHEKFMWDARMEPGVLEAFERIWGTDELLASFDALNITFPNRKDVPRKVPWEHVDQSPLRRGLHCVQGIINLSVSGPEDGGLLVYPGSHLLTENFFDEHTDKSTWTPRDFYNFSRDEISWFESQGLRPHKVCADVGDLILWDSRTIHYGAEPTEKGTTIRTAIYAAYTPSRLASEESLRTKREVFEKWAGTTHWPHDNIRVRIIEARLEDGTIDPRNRIEPREKPELSVKLLKLAGMRPY